MDKEKELLEKLMLEAATYNINSIGYPSMIVLRADIRRLCKIVDKLKKENKRLKIMLNKGKAYIEKFVPIDNDIILMRERQRDYLLEILSDMDKEEKNG